MNKKRKLEETIILKELDNEIKNEIKNEINKTISQEITLTEEEEFELNKIQRINELSIKYNKSFKNFDITETTNEEFDEISFTNKSSYERALRLETFFSKAGIVQHEQDIRNLIMEYIDQQKPESQLVRILKEKLKIKRNQTINQALIRDINDFLTFLGGYNPRLN